jgi:type II secretory pathway pseudopilin PulG
MGADGTSLFLMLVSFGLTFFVARWIGQRLKARRDAEQAAQAERDLASQSRQVRRAAARKKPG